MLKVKLAKCIQIQVELLIIEDETKKLSIDQNLIRD
ncbi:hypothetical protein NEOC65_002050 [Neochlamydia sp. AcF65]|nr:hypothetical protein [Neochlamydia sp. AcF65]